MKNSKSDKNSVNENPIIFNANELNSSSIEKILSSVKAQNNQILFFKDLKDAENEMKKAETKGKQKQIFELTLDDTDPKKVNVKKLDI